MQQTTKRRVLSADSLEGTSVRNREGEDLGELKSIMIDLAGGRVAYAVLSFGGFLGMGDKLFALPWEALRVDQENERIILDAPREVLENAPGFDKDEWPDLGESGYGVRIYEHYGYDPYWEA